MKTGLKVIMLGIALAFGATEIDAQEKKRSKKKEQDLEYMNQKKTMDEKRNREAEDKRRSDSIKYQRYNDSMTEMRRADSVRYSKMGAVDTINSPDKKDTINPDMPPQPNKGVPPKDPKPKGPNPGMGRIEFREE